LDHDPTAAMNEQRDLGYVPRDPRPGQGGELLRDVQSVIAHYQAQLPLAIRQIYYVLLGKFGYPKGRQFERRLSYVMNRGRRARLIDFDHIRDDTSVVYQEPWYADIDHYYRVELERRKGFKRDRMADQPFAIEVHVEARGMGPQIYNVTRDFSIRVYPAGGKAHLTDKHEMAQRIVARGAQRTIVLSLGDFDPHGISMFENLAADVHAFVEVDHVFADQAERFVEFRRGPLRPHRRRSRPPPTATSPARSTPTASSISPIPATSWWRPWPAAARSSASTTTGRSGGVRNPGTSTSACSTSPRADPFASASAAGTCSIAFHPSTAPPIAPRPSGRASV
jgi:hypothetical protein